MVTRLWLGGLLLLMVGAGVFVAGRFVGGADTEYLTAQNYLSHIVNPGVVLVTLGGLTTVAGGLSQFAAWVGATVAASSAERWGWLVALLVLGMIGLQPFVMVAYLLGGPTDKEQERAALVRPSLQT
jgi:hypothetical protein